MKEPSKFKIFIKELIEPQETSTKKGIFFNHFISTLIILTVVLMVFETVDDVYQMYKQEFFMFETFVIAVFTIEYLLRIYISDITHPSENRIKSALKYIFSGYGFIDIISILPYFLPFTGLVLRVVRCLRLFRFLRLFKIGRYNNSLNLIFKVIKNKLPDLGITCFAILMLMLIASFLMFYAEHDAQPESFSSVLECFWWSIVTLTTVGYGDVYPITLVGKILGGSIALLGIGMVALPTGIISSGFLDEIEKRNKEEERKKQQKQEKKQEKEDNKSTKLTFTCPCCGKTFVVQEQKKDS